MDIRIAGLALLISIIFSGCNSNSESSDSGRITIVTTTGMIEDAVKNIVGDKADVQALMGPGVDPHLYKATQGDLQKLTGSDIIFYNGLHLEGKMGEVFEKLAFQKPVVAVANSISPTRLRKVPEFNNNYDPHIWFDVELWQEAVKEINLFMQKYDSTNAAFYQQNANSYLKTLDSLHAFVQQQISTIPETQRVLITAHDAFGYFGEAYDIKVMGLQGISTLSEYGLRDVANLVDFIKTNKIKAVFVETSVSNKAINAVVEGCHQSGYNVFIGGNLYSDAMGDKGSEEGTYVGMVRANVKTIVSALK
jgi:manganese/zinc/iron transport system substrate-binding protein